MANLTRIFVYGTLKRGFPNHKLLANVAKDEHAVFVSEGYSSEKFPVVITSEAFVPFMLDYAGAGENTRGEVYDVCDKVLDKLDDLESNGILYDRRLISVILSDENFNNKSTKANAYLIRNFRENLLDLPLISNYTLDHAKLYKPRVEREEDLSQIVKLVKKDC